MSNLSLLLPFSLSLTKETFIMVPRYPYISCEVFCCEVPDILHVLVEYQDNKFLKKLLSLLDCESPLDAHLAGYFEKILEMLFRRMTVPVLAYVNAGGIPLMQRFLKQIDNYSIMQVVQRLMLPHIPFSMANDIDEIPVEERHNYQCNWSYLPEACDMLCVRMLDTENAEVPSHVSDLLITVLQLSPPDAMILSHLCKPECLEKIFSSAFVNFSDAQSAIESPTPQSSVSLAALSVLESLISRLCEALGPSVEETSSDGLASEENQLFRQLREAVANVCSALVPYLPSICSQLKRYTEESPCGSIMTQAKVLQPRLGHRGLLTVKFVESVVRLGNVSVDRQLCESGVLRASVDLVFTFEFNSLLHLTVQRIVLMIVEGGPSRRYKRLVNVFVLKTKSVPGSVSFIIIVMCYLLMEQTNSESILV
jgi:serine/threonine-protein phosphatase 6 regulatory subunit 3